jgi:hypothetical protein
MVASNASLCRGALPWAVSVVLVVGCDGKGLPGYCLPEVTAKHAEPKPVTRVDVFWDVSESIQKTFRRRRAPNAYALLRNDLINWVRGLAAKDTPQHTVGKEVGEYTGGAFPPLTAGYTNLPDAASMIANLLAEDEQTAAILVSDMRVDRPPKKEGGEVCGTVKEVRDNGKIPAYFGQCLTEPWARVPAWTNVTGIMVTAKDETIRGSLPLFVMIISRNASFSADLTGLLGKQLATDFDVSSLVLANHRPSIPCERLGKCGYRTRSDIVALHQDERGSHQCSFRATENRGSHALRCEVLPAKPEQGAGIQLRRAQVQSLDPKLVQVAASGGHLDLRANLAALERGTVRAPVRFNYEWVLAEDLDTKIKEWLGPWGNDHDYLVTFRVTAAALHEKFRPPRCDEEWSIPYTH